MSYRFIIDTAQGLIRETWTDTIDLTQLIASSRDEWSHPDYRRGLNLLTDFRRARGRITADDVLRFASWFCNDAAPPRHAIVVRRERAFDFSSMFAMIRESTGTSNGQTRIFFSYSEAEAWVRGVCSAPPSQRQARQRIESRTVHERH